MNTNEQLLHNFYTAFKNKDYKLMQACYADNAVFNDPIFKDLTAKQVRAMWQMLISSAKDFSLELAMSLQMKKPAKHIGMPIIHFLKLAIKLPIGLMLLLK